MYEAVNHLHQSSDKGFTMNPTAINETTMVIAYADSSWANAENFASQHGCLILLADPRVTEVSTPACLIDFLPFSQSVPQHPCSRSQRSRYISGSVKFLQSDANGNVAEHSIFQGDATFAHVTSDGLQILVRQHLR